MVWELSMGILDWFDILAFRGHFRLECGFYKGSILVWLNWVMGPILIAQIWYFKVCFFKGFCGLAWLALDGLEKWKTFSVLVHFKGQSEDCWEFRGNVGLRGSDISYMVRAGIWFWCGIKVWGSLCFEVNYRPKWVKWVDLQMRSYFC